MYIKELLMYMTLFRVKGDKVLTKKRKKWRFRFAKNQEISNGRRYF